MSRDFDALDEWLKIPPENQPPDHYRLLGLRAFEADPAAIAEAARRQIAQVEKLGGQRPAHARAVIERLRAAERSLKTPETKAAYDRSLRERQAGASATTIPGAAARAPAIQWRRWLVGLACGAVLVIVVGVSASRDRAKPGETALAHQAAAVTDSSSKQPRALTAQQQATGNIASNSASGQPPPAETPPAAVADNGAGPPAAGSNAWPPDWLQLNERGEPRQATLADGTVLKLDAYGETYEAWRIAPPVKAEQCEAVIDYQRDGLGAGWGISGLQLDAAAGKMYWIEKVSHEENIRSAGMDGSDPIRLLVLASQKPQVKLGVQQAQGLSIDPQRGKMYWSSNAGGGAFGKGPAAAHAVWRAGLDGSDPDPLFGALTQPGEIAVEPQSGTIYYFDDLRLMRGGTDGANEAVVIERLVLGGDQARGAFGAAIDPIHGKIYWCGRWGITRANLDGAGFEDVINSRRVFDVAVDSHDEKMYWTTNKEVWRANVDGSRPELVALGMPGCGTIDVDLERGYVYFGDVKFVKGHGYQLIRRLKFPPLAVTETTPAPPFVFSFDPPRQRAGGKVEVRGRRFSGVAAVRVIGDDGRQSDVEFTLIDDAKLTFVVPPRREGVKRLAIVVEGPGGLTVTLPHDTHAVRREDAPTPFVKFDRTRDGGRFCFAVSQDARFINIERSLVYVPAGAEVSTGNSRGDVVYFLKDGSLNHAVDATGIVVYHEPYARIFGRADRKLGPGGLERQGDHQYIPVPAIRPSFVESLLEYEQAE